MEKVIVAAGVLFVFGFLGLMAYDIHSRVEWRKHGYEHYGNRSPVRGGKGRP